MSLPKAQILSLRQCEDSLSVKSNSTSVREFAFVIFGIFSYTGYRHEVVGTLKLLNKRFRELGSNSVAHTNVLVRDARNIKIGSIAEAKNFFR